MRSSALLGVCVWALAATASVAAQSGSPAAVASPDSPPLAVVTRDSEGHVTVRATRISEPLQIDGRLNEDAYQAVMSIEGFIQSEPNEGAPVSERTEVWLLFDDRNIYVTCRCWDASPDRIIANDMRRDSQNLNAHDHLAVVLDTYHDRRDGFSFFVSPSGGMRDMLNTNGSPNINWNAVWQSRTSRFEGGWTVEMAIPFASLRFGPQETWGIQIRRNMPGRNERVHLTRLSPALGGNAMNQMAQAATLVGLRTPTDLQQFELKPYAIANRITDRASSRRAKVGEYDASTGVDVTYSITRNLTAMLSLNTDFAQVEEDEAQVNLTRFSLFLPEKREFFLEGEGIFQFGVGAGPGGGGGGLAPTVFYSRRIGLVGGAAVPVIGGGRVAGKLGRWSVGGLSMVTEKVEGVAGQTSFNVVRVRRDILRRSSVGAIVTHRSAALGESIGSNQVWGIDASLAFFDDIALSGYVSGSMTEGRRGNDLSYRTLFVYNADRYGLAGDRVVAEENFDPGVGFMRRRNFVQNYVQARFSPRLASHPFVRKLTFQGAADYVTDNRSRPQTREIRAEFRSDLHSTDAVQINYSRFREFLDEPFEIVDGVSVPEGTHDLSNAAISYTAGQQRRLSGTSSVGAGRFYGGAKRTVAFRGRLEATARLGIEPRVEVNWVDVPGRGFTTTVTSTRTMFTVSPRMFVAAFAQYDSASTSLSGSVRLRWEYRPGSELFMVYSEGRSTLPVRGTDLLTRGIAVKVNRLMRF